MFDIGGWEFLVIVVIAIIVIGPKDLPATIRTVMGWVRRARELARDFQSGLDDLAREADMDGVKEEIQSGLELDDMRDAGNSIRREIEHSIDPDHEIASAFEDEGMPHAPSDAYVGEDGIPGEPPPHEEPAAPDTAAVVHDSEAPPDDAPADATKKA